MLLYSLDQFSRTRLPHYTGYKPKAPANITMTQPAQGPTTATTYGAGAYQSTKFGVPPVDNTFYNNRCAQREHEHGRGGCNPGGRGNGVEGVASKTRGTRSPSALDGA